MPVKNVTSTKDYSHELVLSYLLIKLNRAWASNGLKKPRDPRIDANVFTMVFLFPVTSN